MKKNEYYLKYVQAMQMMDEGKSIKYVEKHLKMGRDTILLIRQRYLLGGELALLQPIHQTQATASRKVEIVKDIEDNCISLHQAALKYDIPRRTLSRWVHAYKACGEIGLIRRERPKNQRVQEKEEEKLKEKERKQQAKADLEELKRLRERNEFLETENALLKKVKALVEEREARLRAIGQKPSKN